MAKTRQLISEIERKVKLAYDVRCPSSLQALFLLSSESETCILANLCHSLKFTDFGKGCDRFNEVLNKWQELHDIGKDRERVN